MCFFCTKGQKGLGWRPKPSSAVTRKIPKGASSHILKLDGVGPVDNRPSTDKLHPVV